MLHLGLDLSRKRLDVCVLNEAGTKLAVTKPLPDLDGLRHLAKEVAALGGPVSAAIESNERCPRLSTTASSSWDGTSRSGGAWVTASFVPASLSTQSRVAFC